MFFYAIAGLINAVTSTFLGFLVYFKNKKVNTNKIFTLFCLSIAIWGYAYFAWQISTTKEIALFWSRALMVGAIFMPITYFHFVLAFLGKISEKKKFLIFGYFAAFLFLILNFTPLFIKEVGPALSFKFWPQPGVVFHPFILMFFIYFFYSFSLLYRVLQKTTEILRTQIKYLLVGSLFGFFGGATNYFLWYNIPIPPFGSILITLFTILTAFAIIKYHLFNIKILLTELSVGVIGLILLTQAVIAETFWLKILGFGIFALFCAFGYLLIKSIIKEIEYRKKLQLAYEELKKLDKAKSEFISIASHQLRTPLTAIKGYISMMLEKNYGKPPEKMEKPLKNIYLSNERLIKLVNDLLNISRIEAGRMEIKLEKTSIENVIISIVEELENTAKEKNIYLKFEKPKKHLAKISVDKEKIRQVLMNIIDNAIRYTKKGSVTIRLKIENLKLKIIVSDTGTGLTKYEISKMFESFSRGVAGTRLYTEGVGLGLYIARKFIEAHHGKIRVESKGKNKGSTFYIELPKK